MSELYVVSKHLPPESGVVAFGGEASTPGRIESDYEVINSL
jgi:hypothetical protein